MYAGLSGTVWGGTEAEDTTDYTEFLYTYVIQACLPIGTSVEHPNPSIQVHIVYYAAFYCSNTTIYIYIRTYVCTHGAHMYSF